VAILLLVAAINTIDLRTSYVIHYRCTLQKSSLRYLLPLHFVKKLNHLIRPRHIDLAKGSAVNQ
jgi:hypothetical protein